MSRLSFTFFSVLAFHFTTGLEAMVLSPSIKNLRLGCALTKSFCRFFVSLIAIFITLPLLAVLAQAAPSDQLEKAKELYFSGDYNHSINYLKPLAADGNAEAQYYLGLIFKSDTFPKKDINTAMSYFLSAADQNNTSAMWALGQMYENGEGVEKNLLTATDWYRKSDRLSGTLKSQIHFFKNKDNILVDQSTSEVIESLKHDADNGDVEALYKLGKLFDAGKLVSGNESEAFHWYLKAANKGHEYSMFLVGYFYCRGIGVEVDQAKANDWLARSNRKARCE